MNLFLGYYVPYRHTIPLWEMETDYYLHNTRVKGRGTTQSMKEYQMAFGVLDWNDDDGIEATNEKDSLGRSNHRSHSRSTTLGSIDTAMFRAEDQSRRIQRVRNRCDTQNQALSTWWKIAIQKNVQQRMWMTLGHSPVESLLPPRFERLYQPEKMAQFDRFFARSWATPVRRSHSAQHSGESDEENEIAEFRRIISGGRLEPPGSRQKALGDAIQGGVSITTLEDFVADYGFEPQSEPSLKMFVQHHNMMDNEIKRSESELSGK